MTTIIGFEVFSRYILNEPTSWSAEIATYLLVGITFLGLAQAQRHGDHVQVELLLSAVDADRRRDLDILANYLGLIFVLFVAWQMSWFNYQEYINDTRDWGLLATPQWIPEVPVSIGLWIMREAEAIRLGRSNNFAGIIEITTLIRDGLN